MDHTLKIALIQHACSTDMDKDQTVGLTCGMIRDAAGRGAELIVTQELFAGPYFPQAEDESRFALAESIPGPTSDKLCALAKELGVEISGSVFERRAPGLYHNTSVMIDAAGQIIGKYRKMHIPDDPGFYEKYYFTPGDGPGQGGGDIEGWQVQQTRFTKTGMLVCWDQWYPEAARLTAMRGAELLLYPTAIGWCSEDGEQVKKTQRESWQIIQRSHAIANGVFVAAINRVGVEGDLKFWGSSFVADPAGQVIAEAPTDEPCVLLADCDLGLIDKQRKAWPFLRDRRIDAYSDMTRRMLLP